MTNLVMLTCNGTIGLGTQAPAPCGRRVAATSRYTNATGLREDAKEVGWISRRQKFVAPFIHKDGTEGARRWTEPVDLCPEHATKEQIAHLKKERVYPIRDYREQK